MRFDQPILFEIPNFYISSFLSKNSKTISLVIFPMTIIFSPIMIIKGSKTLSFAIHPFTIISVPEQLVLVIAINPDMDSSTILFVVAPVACVFLVCSEPIHSSLPLFYIFKPLPLVRVTAGICHFSISFFISIIKLSFIYRPIWKLYPSFTTSLSVNPLSIIS